MTNPRRPLRVGLVIVGAGFLALALGASLALAAGETVVGKSISGHGRLMVAGSNQMTLYTFTKDVKGSGTSNCTGGCLTTWPALTVAAGATPTGDSSVTGTLGTITRADDGTTQVTYNGLPLYFFSKDKAPGDANGIYPNWEAVILTAGLPATSTVDPVAPSAPAPVPVLAILVVLTAGLVTFVAIHPRVRRNR